MKVSVPCPYCNHRTIRMRETSDIATEIHYIKCSNCKTHWQIKVRPLPCPAPNMSASELEWREKETA